MLSIVVALAAEGLLGRLDQIEALFQPSPNNLLIWTQGLIALVLAAIFWWVAVRWVGSFPWSFGFFDAVGPLGLLVAFHFLVAAVGGSHRQWFAAFGLIAGGGAVIFFVNVRRASRLSDQISASSDALLPTAFGVATGIAALVVAAVSGRLLSVGVQFLLNGLLVAGLAAFAMAEHRVWSILVKRLPPT